jgi:hypothetical protein
VAFPDDYSPTAGLSDSFTCTGLVGFNVFCFMLSSVVDQPFIGMLQVALSALCTLMDGAKASKVSIASSTH